MVLFQAALKNKKLFHLYNNHWYIVRTFTNVFLFRYFFFITRILFVCIRKTFILESCLFICERVSTEYIRPS